MSTEIEIRRRRGREGGQRAVFWACNNMVVGQETDNTIETRAEDEERSEECTTDDGRSSGSGDEWMGGGGV